MSSTTPHYNLNRTILADVVPLRTPYTIQCEVSQFCNLKCNYCMQSFTGHIGKRMMTREAFWQLCEQIKGFDDKLKQVNFSGWGEPLINPWLPVMIQHLKECGVTENIAIVTNGLLLTHELSLKLIAAGVDHIRISLQGMTAERYKEVSSCDMDYLKLVDNIRFLYNHKEDCQVSIKLADVNMDEQEEAAFYETFSEWADRTYIEYIRPVFKENGIEDGKHASKFGNNHPPVIACSQPFFMMVVMATGDISPCCSYYKPEDFGNIKDTTLRKMWESERMKWLWEMMLSKKRKDQNRYPVCQTCMVPDVVMMPEDELDGREDEVRSRL